MNARFNLTICHPRLSSGRDSKTAIVVKSPVPATLPINHVLIKVDRFGYSANNVTYQALGEAPHFRYFDFHPTPEAPESGVSASTHGVTPVWGFGTVVTSTHPKIRAGERVFGYLAPARFVVLPVSPSEVNQHTFFVSRPHFPADRRPYNQITRCAMDPLYDPSSSVEDFAMLFRPLFWTAFWCEDWLDASQYRGGATRILISSASAKTAFCLAYLIRKRGGRRRIVGLTSKKNFEFTTNLGLYDQVLVYDGFENAIVLNEPSQKWIYVDVAGNDGLNAELFRHFSDAKLDLVGSVRLGMTNLSPSSQGDPVDEWAADDSSQAALELFFMPAWLAKRREQLSIDEIAAMQKRAWFGLMQDCKSWGIEIRRVYGGQNVKEAYAEVISAGVPPNRGLVWSMWEEDATTRAARL